MTLIIARALLKSFGYVAVLIGIILIIIGIFANFCSQTTYLVTNMRGIPITTYPYQQYAFPLLVVGIVFDIAGIIIVRLMPKDIAIPRTGSKFKTYIANRILISIVTLIGLLWFIIWLRYLLPPELRDFILFN